MGKEIERKFLVTGDAWKAGVVRRQRMEQGYMAITADCAVRVRIAGNSGILNVKSATLDIERQEYEYAIPVEDAREMLESLCKGRVLSKLRHWVEHQGDLWEVDVFEGGNEGLILAEIELEHRTQRFAVPEWAGPEVSGDERYLNSYLAVTPYTTWGRV